MSTGNALHDELRRTVDRWPQAASAAVSRWSRQKVGEVATAQSRRVLAEAKAELLNRAMRRFVTIVYDGAPHVWYNIDAVGTIVTPTPWSRQRHAEFGISDPDSRALRIHVADVLASLPPRRALFWYDEGAGRWHLNRGSFPELAQALDWVEGPGRITPARWLTISASIPRRGQKNGR